MTVRISTIDTASAFARTVAIFSLRLSNVVSLLKGGFKYSTIDWSRMDEIWRDRLRSRFQIL